MGGTYGPLHSQGLCRPVDRGLRTDRSPGVGADYDRHALRVRAGRARGRGPGRDRHTGQRCARHHDRHADEHRRRLRLSERHRRHLSGPRHNGRVQDARTARSGREPGRPRPSADADDRGRHAGGDGHRSSRHADRAGLERRALVHHPRRGGREPADRQSRLRQPGVARAGCLLRHQPEPNRRRRPEQHHDGRHLDDGYRQQRDPAADERRVDRGSEGPHLELPGGIRPLERLADHGRDQERHQPVPRLGLRRVQGLGLERQQPDQRPERRSEDGAERKGSRVFDRRPGRPAGWQQQAVLLLQPRVRAADRRQQRRPLPHADGTRTGRRFLAVLRQQRRALSLYKGPAAVGHVLGDQPGRLLQRRRRARQDSRQPPLSDRHQPAESLSAAEHQRRRPGLQLRAHPARREGARAAARDSHRLPANPEAARDGEVLGLHPAQPGVQRHAARLQRRPAAGPGHQHPGDDRELQHELLDVLRGDLRAEPERLRRMHLRPGRHRPGLLHDRHPAQRRLQPRYRGPRRPADDLSGCAAARHPLLRSRDPREHAAAVLGRRSAPDYADQRDLGQPHRESAAEHDLPGLPQHQCDQGLRRERDQGGGAAHVEGRVLQQSQQQVAEPEQRGDVRRAEFLERHQQPDRRAVRVRQRGARRLHVLQPAVALYRGQVSLQQHRGLHPGQLEGEQPDHARLRRALRAHAAPGPIRSGRRRISFRRSGPRVRPRCCSPPAASGT